MSIFLGIRAFHLLVNHHGFSFSQEHEWVGAEERPHDKTRVQARREDKWGAQAGERRREQEEVLARVHEKAEAGAIAQRSGEAPVAHHDAHEQKDCEFAEKPRCESSAR